MKITKEAEKLFNEWAQEAAKEATKALKRVPVLPLKKKVTDFLHDLSPGDEFVEFNGRNYKLREFVKVITDYADLFRRTDMSKAATMRVLRECREYDNDLVEVSSHQSPCVICAKYEGKIFSISGKHPIYPVVTLLPPFHAGCSHGIYATSDIAIKWREKRDNFERVGTVFDGLSPDDNWGSIDGKPYTVREWAELLVARYGDREAAHCLASLKNK